MINVLSNVNQPWIINQEIRIIIIFIFLFLYFILFILYEIAFPDLVLWTYVYVFLFIINYQYVIKHIYKAYVILFNKDSSLSLIYLIENNNIISLWADIDSTHTLHRIGKRVIC